MHHRAFTVAVRLTLAVVLALVFSSGEVTALAEASPAQNFETRSLPIKSLPRNTIFYPSVAKRQGLTGRICLAYSVGATGLVQNVEVLESAGTILDDHAQKLLAGYRFEVPSDWVATGGAEKRYRIGFIFELTNKPKVARFEDTITTVVITGGGLPGG